MLTATAQNGKPPHRILVVHNAYKQIGGEDNVVDAEVELLREHGHALHVYQRRNEEVDQIAAASLALQTIWSRRTTNDIVHIANDFRPDVIHAHNTFPLVSPSLYWAAQRINVPVVQTLHNFRFICLQAMLRRNGRVCQDCVGHGPWRGILHSCYRDSTTYSAVLGCMLAAHSMLGTFRDHVTRYVALSEFSRDRFVAGGIPRDRISVKPNFTRAPELVQTARTGALFVGRLSEEKGLKVLVDALARLSGSRCQVIGDGPDAPMIEDNPAVVHLGRRSREQVMTEMRRAMYLIVPSVCFENFPLVIAEAFACGLPVVASRLGAMAEIVEHEKTGLLFEAGSSKALASAMQWAESNPTQMQAMGANARRAYELRYTPDCNYRQLIAIYDAAWSFHRPTPTHVNEP